MLEPDYAHPHSTEEEKKEMWQERLSIIEDTK